MVVQRGTVSRTDEDSGSGSRDLFPGEAGVLQSHVGAVQQQTLLRVHLTGLVVVDAVQVVVETSDTK